MKRKLLVFVIGLTLVALSCSLPGSTEVPTETIPTPVSTLLPEPIVNLPATDGELSFASERDGQWQIMVMNADGSGETSLTAPFGNFSYPAWSPDGNRLAMRVDYSDNPGDNCNSGIAIMDLPQQDGGMTGSLPLKITCAFSDAPDWSPDGTQVLYISSPSSGWEFFRYDLNNAGTTTIPGVSPWSRDPKWSPDGTRILFSADVNNNGNSDIFLVNLDGSGLVQLTSNDHYDGFPNWSPDGSKIVFSSTEDGNSNLYTMNADGSGLTRLTSDPGNDFDAAWSPDGTRIAFATDRHDNFNSNYEIYLINADGTGEMRLTNNTYTDRWPDWRPGSTANGQAACQPTANFVADVTIPTGTRFLTPVSFNKVWRLENPGTCVWTPDAYRLRFVEGDLMNGPVSSHVPGAIQAGSSVELAIPLTAPSTPGQYNGKWQLWDENGNPVPDASGNPLTLTVSIEVLPDGQSILPAPLYYLVGENESRQVWRMGTDGQVSQITFEPAGVSNFDISPVDGRVAYLSNNQFLLVDATGAGRQVLVTAGVDESLSSPVWSPDGTRLAYGRDGIHIYTLATGEDRLILANNNSIYAGEFRRYTPLSWSPDGNKIAVFIGYYEWIGLGITSTGDGALLSEFEPGDSLAWSTDSQTLFQARVPSYGMLSQEPGLFSISATAGASLQTLIPNTSTWWPHQRPDGRLLYFMGPPGSNDTSATMPVSLVASLPDGVTEQQTLRSNLLWLSVGEFPEALWTPDGSHVITHLSHALSKTSEILYISAEEQPFVFLMQEGSGFRWGR